MHTKELDLLFVYGTLMHAISTEMSALMRAHATRHTEGYFLGKVYDLGEYPGAVLSGSPQDKVWGQVYQIQQAGHVFPLLDAYEGIGAEYAVPHMYLRKKVPIVCDSKMLLCWVYLYNWPIEQHRRIASGNYLEYLRHK